MSGDPRISVIVPVFNAGSYIKQCMDSLLCQSLAAYEIVAIDDGSTDDSLAILLEYANKHSVIKVFPQQQLGVGEARAKGLEMARGDYVAWLDADDVLAPDALEKLYRVLDSHGADYVYCGLRLFPKAPAAKAVWFKPFKGCVDWDFIERNSQCTNSLTSKRLLNEIDAATLFRVCGEFAWVMVLLNAKTIAYTDEELYLYRVGHSSSSGGSYRGKVAKFRHGVTLAKNLAGMAISSGKAKGLTDYFHYRVIYSVLLYLVVAAVNRDRHAYMEAKEWLSELNYRENPLTKEILDHNHGRVKSFVLRNIMTNSYGLAVFLATMFLAK